MREINLPQDSDLQHSLSSGLLRTLYIDDIFYLKNTLQKAVQNETKQHQKAPKSTCFTGISNAKRKIKYITTFLAQGVDSLLQLVSSMHRQIVHLFFCEKYYLCYLCHPKNLGDAKS